MTGQHRDETWDQGDEYPFESLVDSLVVILIGFTFISAFGLAIFNVARSTHWTLALLVATLVVFALGYVWHDHCERTRGLQEEMELPEA